MIHVFHGFLGSPDDFSFLKSADVVLHDLYEMQTFPAVAEHDILIGYSMGGRMALELAYNCNFRIKKLILVSAHPGLSNEEERKNRVTFEADILFKLKELSRDQFLSWWNKLPIFSADLPIESSPERFLQSAELFEKYRLSKQKDFLPLLIEHKNKILYITGTQDKKYMEFAENRILPEGLKVKTINGGHRLFQKNTELIKILQDEGIL